MDAKQYTIEGFEDFRGEFDTGIYICKPIVDCIDGSRIENVIEDFCIDASIDDEPESDGYLAQKPVMDCFYRVRKKKVTPNFRYFRAVVEVYPYGHPLHESEVYRILEHEGF